MYISTPYNHGLLIYFIQIAAAIVAAIIAAIVAIVFLVAAAAAMTPSPRFRSPC